MESTARLCTTCNQPATLTCGACKDTPTFASLDGDRGTTTWYCSKKCQAEGWKEHKVVCKRLKTRKMFCRAGGLLQELFCNYREIMFDKLIDKIERNGNNLLLYKGKFQPAAPTTIPQV